jgi:cellulose synthase/poly-beta-1,6-N-acetylglucosamine synthase-like glycosyltransferase
VTGGYAADYAVVIPTVGRPSLRAVLAALAEGIGPAPAEVVVVDDRPALGPALAGGRWPPVRVLRSGGRGPAAARNVGWRAVDTEWVAFLDDDVVPDPDWPARLHADLVDLPPEVGGSQGRIVVPLPGDRRATDIERGTAGLATARWITADMAYRRAALQLVGGFDERFPRAYREDADLALRVAAAGYRLVRGRRRTVHPVRPAGFLASVRAQAGNADNALMRRLHGPSWRDAAGQSPGRLRWHALSTAAAVAATWLAAARRPVGARLAALAWLALTAEFALRRILPGPRTPAEVARMVVTSVAIPPAACAHRVAGELRWARVSRVRVPSRDRPPDVSPVRRTG